MRDLPPSIVVCPASRLAETLAATGARSVVTLLAADRRTGLPALDGLRHLAIDIADIVTPLPRHVLPGPDHVRDILAFAARWDRRSALLIHCYAGVSRAPAAAFAVACALEPDVPERTVAARLRAASPRATPNPRLVALADAALGRDGRMIDAVRAIGRGCDCFEGDVFALPVPPREATPQIPAYQS